MLSTTPTCSPLSLQSFSCIFHWSWCIGPHSKDPENLYCLQKLRSISRRSFQDVRGQAERAGREGRQRGQAEGAGIRIPAGNPHRRPPAWPQPPRVRTTSPRAAPCNSTHPPTLPPTPTQPNMYTNTYAVTYVSDRERERMGGAGGGEE